MKINVGNNIFSFFPPLSDLWALLNTEYMSLLSLPCYILWDKNTISMVKGLACVKVSAVF